MDDEQHKQKTIQEFKEYCDEKGLDFEKELTTVFTQEFVREIYGLDFSKT